MNPWCTRARSRLTLAKARWRWWSWPLKSRRRLPLQLHRAAHLRGDRRMRERHHGHPNRGSSRLGAPHVHPAGSCSSTVGESEDYPEIVVSDNCTPTSDLPLDISNFLLDSECEGSRVLQRQAQSVDAACGNVGQAFHLVTILGHHASRVCVVSRGRHVAVPQRRGIAMAHGRGRLFLLGGGGVGRHHLAGLSPKHRLVRTFVATDACGNEAEASHTVSYRDTTPPQLNLPENDVEVACDADWVFDGTGLAHDLCSEVTWEVQSQLTAPEEGSVFSLLGHGHRLRPMRECREGTICGEQRRR